ncbi:MAG: hypothetical protein R2852_07840 [Bacteroidia bacterium]
MKISKYWVILILFFSLPILSIGQTTKIEEISKHHVGIQLSGSSNGLQFSNTQGIKTNYAKRFSPGWGMAYAYKEGVFLGEVNVGFSGFESYLNTTEVQTNVSMDFMRTAIKGSVLLFKGPVHFKLGVGFGSGHILSGVQKINTTTSELNYKSTELAFLGDVGLVFQPNSKTLIQFCYAFRKGLSNLENSLDQLQKTTTTSNGIQATIYFGF